MGEPIAVHHLLNILAAGYDNIREEAVALLSQLADKSISPRLLELLKGTNQAIRESALNVLSKIEFPSDTETLLEALKNDDYWARNQILEKIVKVASVSGLITALGYNNSKASWQIAEKLAAHTLSPEDKDMLLACLRSEVVRIRAFVVEALGRRDDIELGTQLQPLIQDQNSLVCALAIRAVGRLQQQDAIPLLKEKLEDTTIIFSNSDEIVSDEAAIALGKLNELSAIPKLLAALNRSGQQVRDEAVPLLIRFGGKSLVPQLLNILEGGTEGTAESASKVIMAISDKTITGKLIKLLPNNQWYVRYRAIELLGYYGKETTKKKLHEFIEDENEKVQKITVFSLMRLGDLSILSKLTSYTIHENWEIRKEVAELIEEIKEPSTSGILLELLRDDDSDVRAAAIKASKYYNDAQIVRGLIDALNDESYTMRGEQICELTKESLGAIGTVDALEAVVSWENRREASQPEGPGDTPF